MARVARRWPRCCSTPWCDALDGRSGTAQSGQVVCRRTSRRDWHASPAAAAAAAAAGWPARAERRSPPWRGRCSGWRDRRVPGPAGSGPRRRHPPPHGCLPGRSRYPLTRAGTPVATGRPAAVAAPAPPCPSGSRRARAPAAGPSSGWAAVTALPPPPVSAAMAMAMAMGMPGLHGVGPARVASFAPRFPARSPAPGSPRASAAAPPRSTKDRHMPPAAVPRRTPVGVEGAARHALRQAPERPAPSSSVVAAAVAAARWMSVRSPLASGAGDWPGATRPPPRPDATTPAARSIRPPTVV